LGTVSESARDASPTPYISACGLLLRHLGEDPARYDARAPAAVREMTGGHRAATAKQVATVARAVLRYLTVEGRCRTGLDAAILLAPRPAQVAPDWTQHIIYSSSAVCIVIDPLNPTTLADYSVAIRKLR
jgi:hypothetical protein